MALMEVFLLFLSLSSTVSRVVCWFFKCTMFPDDVEGLENGNFCPVKGGCTRQVHLVVLHKSLSLLDNLN